MSSSICVAPRPGSIRPSCRGSGGAGPQAKCLMGRTCACAPVRVFVHAQCVVGACPCACVCVKSAPLVAWPARLPPSPASSVPLACFAFAGPCSAVSCHCLALYALCLVLINRPRRHPRSKTSREHRLQAGSRSQRIPAPPTLCSAALRPPRDCRGKNERGQTEGAQAHPDDRSVGNTATDTLCQANRTPIYLACTLHGSRRRAKL